MAEDRRSEDITPGARQRIEALDAHYRKIAKALILGMVVSTIAVVLSLVGVAVLFGRLHDSRRKATGISCGVASAVVDAGRAVITGSSSNQDPVFLRNLEKLGYPPRKVRDAQARALAQKYSDVITARVAQQVGAKTAKDVIRNGNLDCNAVLRVSHLDH